MADELKSLIKENGKWIKIFLGKEIKIDPFSEETTATLFNSIPIKGLVTDLTFAKIQWAMPGVMSDKAKEIIIPKSKESLLQQSQKLKIDDEYYEGWRQNGKLQYRIEGDYLRAYVYLKKT